MATATAAFGAQSFLFAPKAVSNKELADSRCLKKQM